MNDKRTMPKPNLPPVINYRDPGNDYRSPPARKPDLPPMTDEQRLAAMLLAAKTESTPRKDADHEQPTSADDAQSNPHADADPATAEPIE